MANKSLESRLREEDIVFEALTDAGKRCMGEVGDKMFSVLMSNGTLPYEFQEPYSGKFIYENGERFSFIALGTLGNEESRGSILHRYISELKTRAQRENYNLNVSGAGLVRIVPELETIVFYGSSNTFGVSFSKEDLLPVAKYVYEKSGGKIKKALFFPQLSNFRNIRKEFFSEKKFSDPALRSIFENKFGLEMSQEERLHNNFYNAIAYIPSLEYAIADLEKEFGGKENGK